MVNEQYQDKIFDESKDVPFTNIEPLVNEPYTYENIVNNPIIKPIAELDRSLRDIEEMINKKLIDSKRNQAWVNSAIGDIPDYQDSSFISRLITLTKDTQDIIKLQDIQLRNFKVAVREIVEIVKKMYGVRVDEEQEYTDVETVIPDEGYKGYLENLIKSSNPEVSKIAGMIKEVFDKDKVSKNERQRFDNSCTEIYKNEAERSTKEIIGKIIRMEFQ